VDKEAKISFCKLSVAVRITGLQWIMDCSVLITLLKTQCN